VNDRPLTNVVPIGKKQLSAGQRLLVLHLLIVEGALPVSAIVSRSGLGYVLTGKQLGYRLNAWVTACERQGIHSPIKLVGHEWMISCCPV